MYLSEKQIEALDLACDALDSFAGNEDCGGGDAIDIIAEMISKAIITKSKIKKKRFKNKC